MLCGWVDDRLSKDRWITAGVTQPGLRCSLHDLHWPTWAAGILRNWSDPAALLLPLMRPRAVSQAPILLSLSWLYKWAAAADHCISSSCVHTMLSPACIIDAVRMNCCMLSSFWVPFLMVASKKKKKRADIQVREHYIHHFNLSSAQVNKYIFFFTCSLSQSYPCSSLPRNIYPFTSFLYSLNLSSSF